MTEVILSPEFLGNNSGNFDYGTLYREMSLYPNLQKKSRINPVCMLLGESTLIQKHDFQGPPSVVIYKTWIHFLALNFNRNKISSTANAGTLIIETMYSQQKIGRASCRERV